MKWLLLRGLGRQSKHWGDFPTQLKNSGVASEVLSLDLPGVGTEAERSCPTVLPNITNDLRKRWLNSQGPVMGGEWGVLGISLGGMVALDWISRYPQDFRRAVIVNSSAKGHGGTLQRLRPEALGWCIFFLSTPSVEMRERAILRLVSNIKRIPPAWEKSWIAIAKEQPMNRINVMKQLWAAGGFEPTRSTVPTLFLNSALDRMVSERASGRLARAMGGKLVTHEWAGHDLILDDPLWVLEQIKKP